MQIMMTAKAKEIGMENTNFANSSGINNTKNVSTVKDILIMSNYLIKNFPEEYKMFAEKEFTWDRTGGDPITQGNRNPLLYKSLAAVRWGIYDCTYVYYLPYTILVSTLGQTEPTSHHRASEHSVAGALRS